MSKLYSRKAARSYTLAAMATCRALLIVLRKLFKGIAANQSTGISFSASPVSLLCSVVASSIAWQRAFGIPSIGNSTAVHVFVGGFYGLNSQCCYYSNACRSY